MSDANKTKLLYVAETTFNETQAGSKKLQTLRLTSESLGVKKNTIVSEELRSDRMRSDLILVGMGCEGAFDVEWSLETYNELVLAALMASAWTTAQASITATSNASAQTITATVGTFSATVQAAKMVKVAGFANSGNNGIFRVVSCNGTVLTLAPGSLTGNDETTKSGVTVDVKYARNGVATPSFFFEKQFPQLTAPHYFGLSGCMISEWGMTLEAQQRALGTFSLIGATPREAAATFGDGSPTAATTKKILNTVGNVRNIVLNGTAMTVPVMSFDFRLNNNLRERASLGTLYTLALGTGTIDITGTLQAYWEDATFLDALIDHDELDLVIPMWDADLNGMSIHLPAVKLSAGSPQASGINTEVMVPSEFQAFMDGSLGYEIQVDALALA